MRVTIYQPQYFPRLHYFNRLLSADAFVILDSAQYTKSLLHIDGDNKQRHPSFQSTTPIKTAAQNKLISVSVRHNGLAPINETGIDYSQKWNANNIFELKKNYGRADQYEEVIQEIKEIINKEYQSLAELNINTILWGINRLFSLNIPVKSISIEKVNAALQLQKEIRLKKIMRDKDTGAIRPEGLQKGTEWTTAICRAIGADEYYNGGTAQQNYMDLDYYKQYGITTVLQDWKCREYKQQLEKQGFIPNLSILDLLLNVPPEEAKRIVIG